MSKCGKIYYTLVIFTGPKVDRDIVFDLYEKSGHSNIIFDVTMPSINIAEGVEIKRVDISNISGVDFLSAWCFKSFINYVQFITKVRDCGPFLLYNVNNVNNTSSKKLAHIIEHPLCSRIIFISTTNGGDENSSLYRDWPEMLSNLIQTTNLSDPAALYKEYFAEAGRWKFMDKTEDTARQFLIRSQGSAAECSVTAASIGTRNASNKYYNFDKKNVNCVQFYSSNPTEERYLKLIEKIIVSPAPIKKDRTGTGTKSLFAKSFSSKLYRMTLISGHRSYRAILPLLTTKNVFFKSVYEELLWFLRGESNAKLLSARGCNIWNANASREALDKLPAPICDYEEGECGPIYGHQWRNFNSAGIDQIENIIHLLKTDPTSRRIVLTAWNPAQLHLMALPPCHILAVFYTKAAKKDDQPRGLYCHLTMRSTDCGLGLPFNIASYSLLTHMLALCSNMRAKRLKITMVDCHVYSNHIEGLSEQIRRDTSKTFPPLALSDKIAKKIIEGVITIDDFDSDDIYPIDYYPDASIKMKMAV